MVVVGVSTAQDRRRGGGKGNRETPTESTRLMPTTSSRTHPQHKYVQGTETATEPTALVRCACSAGATLTAITETSYGNTLPCGENYAIASLLGNLQGTADGNSLVYIRKITFSDQGEQNL